MNYINLYILFNQSSQTTLSSIWLTQSFFLLPFTLNSLCQGYWGERMKKDCLLQEYQLDRCNIIWLVLQNLSNNSNHKKVYTLFVLTKNINLNILKCDKFSNNLYNYIFCVNCEFEICFPIWFSQISLRNLKKKKKRFSI